MGLFALSFALALLYAALFCPLLYIWACFAAPHCIRLYMRPCFMLCFALSCYMGRIDFIYMPVCPLLCIGPLFGFVGNSFGGSDKSPHFLVFVFIWSVCPLLCPLVIYMVGCLSALALFGLLYCLLERIGFIYIGLFGLFYSLLLLLVFNAYFYLTFLLCLISCILEFYNRGQKKV